MSKNIIKLDQLIRIAEDVPWETFEAMPDGRLLLQDRAQTLVPDEEDTSPLLWVFEMRVGLHFERPMQAIMSCGHFIRMRSTLVYENCILGKLDPECPGACLYRPPMGPYQQTQYRPPMDPYQQAQLVASTWRPTPPQYGLTGQYQQSLTGQYQSLTGQGPNQTITTVNTSTYQQGTLSRLAGAWC